MIKMIIRMARIMARITHVPHLFSMKHVFLEVNTASLSIQKKKKGRKNLNSNNHLGDTNFQLIKRMCVN